MGDPPRADWPDEDDVDWVRLYALRPDLWYAMLRDLGARPEPAALARFVDKCIISIRCLTDVHAQLPSTGLTLARFVELREAAWEAQFAAVEREDRPIGDDEHVDGWGDNSRNKKGRLNEQRANWRPDLEDALAPEMRAAVINLHLRGLTDTAIVCALDIPADWPEKIISRARIHPNAKAAIRAHLEGGSLATVAKASGVPATTAVRILRQIGEAPNGAQARVDAGDRARTILKLRDRGLSYKEIAHRLDCSMDVVKNVLRRDRRHRYGRGGPAA